MAKKKSQPKPAALVVVDPIESESKKQLRLDDEFWRGFEAENSKYWSAYHATWRKYETALKADLSENPKRHIRMPYDDQYDSDIKAAVDGWNVYFDASSTSAS